MDKVKDAINKLEKELKKDEALFEDKNNVVGMLEQEVKTKEGEIVLLERRIEEAKSEADAIKTKIDSNQQEINSLPSQAA